MNRIITLSALLGAITLGMMQTGFTLYSDHSVVDSDGQLAFFLVHLKRKGRWELATLAIDESTDEMFINSNGDVVALDDGLAKEILKEGVLAKLITGASGIRIDESSCDENLCPGEVISSLQILR